MSLSDVRRRIRRATDNLAERTRASNLAAAGRVHEAREVVSRLNGPVAAIEVNRTQVTRSLDDTVPTLHSRFDTSDVGGGK